MLRGAEPLLSLHQLYKAQEEGAGDSKVFSKLLRRSVVLPFTPSPWSSYAQDTSPPIFSCAYFASASRAAADLRWALVPYARIKASLIWAF